MKTVKIDRKKWARGTRFTKKYRDVIENTLWSNRYKVGCCLGHVIKQTTHCSWDDLNCKSRPSDFYDKKSILSDVITDSYDDLIGGEITETEVVNNKLAKMAMEINDNQNFSGLQREKNLTKLFAKHKIKLVFYG